MGEEVDQPTVDRAWSGGHLFPATGGEDDLAVELDSHLQGTESDCDWHAGRIVTFEREDVDSEVIEPYRTKSDYDRCVRKIESFESEELLRGVPVASVLHRFGRILSSNAGKGSDYDQSVPAGKIDAFISHTWSTPRFSKFLTLVMVYNFHAAIAISLASAFVTCVLVGCGRIRQVFFLGSDGTPMDDGETCQIVGYVTFLIVLCTWHEVANACGWQGELLFLDKACVHQTDADLKRQGIKSLAAFLRNSRSLVVLYTDAYPKRLWTVYEMASFLVLHPERDVQIVPTDHSRLLLAALGLFLSKLICCFVAFGHCTKHQQYLAKQLGIRTGCVANMFMVAVILAVSFESWAKTFRRMQQQLEEFDIRAAECASEDDRPIVESNVEAFVKHAGVASPHAPKEDALQAFNRLVRHTVPSLMTASLGKLGVRYNTAILISVCFLFKPLDGIAHHVLRHGYTFQSAFVDGVSMAAVCWFCGPLVVAVAAAVAKASAHLTGAAALAAGAANVLAISLAEHALWALMLTLKNLARDNLAALVCYLAVCCAMLLLARVVYRSPETSRRPDNSSGLGLPSTNRLGECLPHEGVSPAAERSRDDPDIISRGGGVVTCV